MTDKNNSEFNKKYLEFKEKYRKNPITFVEEFTGVKLSPWQKLLIKMIDFKNKVIYRLIPYRKIR